MWVWFSFVKCGVIDPFWVDFLSVGYNLKCVREN